MAQDSICYHVVDIDRVIFNDFYLILLNNENGDTLFLISAKAGPRLHKDFVDYNETFSVGDCYKLNFTRKDSLFSEKLSRRYSRIEHLEIKYGDKIFWEDHLIQVPIYYSEQVYDLCYQR
jgi:hypothetical protein